MAKPGKGPGGRPSAYRPEYCDRIREFMSQGFSVAAFAGEVGVARSTVYKWADDHPEFSDALKSAQALSALWWERAAVNLAVTGDGNATMIVFGLKNRVADEWRDKQAVEHTGPDGGPVRVQTVDPSKLSTEALRELMGAMDATPDTDGS